MIKYALICQNNHDFDAWFSSSDDFDKQKRMGLVACPTCNSDKVEKTLMAPAVNNTKKNNSVQKSVPDKASLQAMIPPEQQHMLEMARKIRNEVEKNAENVGDKFPEEARKIHYGDSKQRGIYGQANQKEVKELLEEGVEILPMPVLPEDRN